MVLSAMTEIGGVVTPYRMLAQGWNTHDAYDLIRESQKEGEVYYCPHCFKATGDRIPVRFRGTSPENAKPHFFHLNTNGEKCAAYTGESEAHILAKDYIAEWLRQKGADDVFPEYHLNNLEGQIRRPDIVAIYGDGRKIEAHEIQLSPHNSSQIAERTDDILAQCLKEWPGADVNVTWYLSGGNARKRDVKDYFLESPSNVWGYRLQWDGEDKIPSWSFLLAPAEVAAYREKQQLAARREQQRIDQERRAQEREDLERSLEGERLLRRQLEQEQTQAQRDQWEASRPEREAKAKADAEKWAQEAEQRRLAEAERAANEARLAQEYRDRRLEESKQGIFYPGETVKGVTGRSSANWKGKIVKAKGTGYIVDWDGRRNHEDPRVRKTPELFMLPEQIELHPAFSRP